MECKERFYKGLESIGIYGQLFEKSMEEIQDKADVDY